MKPVIQIENVSKQYRLGPKQRASYRTLRETMWDSLARPWGWLKTAARLRRKQAAAATVPGPDHIWALDDVSFAVSPGEVLGIIGRNGAGKSTMLKILSRITEPTSGCVRLRGRVGSLLEVGTGFHPELTGRENIYLNGVILGMSRREVGRRFDDIVAFSEVEKFLDTPVKRYSSGMYVRLAFAVAAHLEPEILIVDEVLAVGDVAFQKKCLGRMGDIAKSGRTILFVSHNMAAVQNLCTRAVLLAKGRVERAGDCADVLAAYLGPEAHVGQQSGNLQSHRPPDALPVIQDITITDDHGKRTNRFFTGDGMVVHLRYDSPVPLTNPVFGIFVRGMTGERLFHLQTLAHHGLVDQLSARGVATCRVPALPLQPGRYVLSFNCSTLYLPGNLDFLDGPLVIDIEGADYFGTGRLPPSQNGSFLVKATWEFSGDGMAIRPSAPEGETDLHERNGQGTMLTEEET